MFRLWQTGPDGEEHTTRTVTEGGESSPEAGDDLMSAVLAPLMGDLPDVGRVLQDVTSVDEAQHSVNAAAPKQVPAKTMEQPTERKQVSEDAAKRAVKTAVTAEGADLDSPETRKA